MATLRAPMAILRATVTLLFTTATHSALKKECVRSHQYELRENSYSCEQTALS